MTNGNPKPAPTDDAPWRIYTPGTVLCDLLARAGTGESQPRIKGYAAVFYDGTPATEYRIGRYFIERVMRGAFKRAVERRDDGDVVGLSNHKAELLLGRQSAGTLHLVEDAKGLAYTIEPPQTTVARDLIENLRLRNVTGSSFSFRPISERWTHDAARDIDVVELLDVVVRDVGPVTFPAYEATEAEIQRAVAARDAWCAQGRPGLAERLRAYKGRADMIP
jgi:Escherichia/Staphylococcus phage prohead protease